jgi:AcrR family transcriptional regulator
MATGQRKEKQAAGEQAPADTPSWRRAQSLALKQAIQNAALRLFGEHGYAGTTVAMIAEEVGIAERTCYRHFPTKPDLVLWDGADYDMLAHFRSRPAGENVIAAFREALRAGQATLTAQQRELEQRRSELIRTVPEIRAAHLDHFTSGASDFTEAVAERIGRKADDPEVLAITGAIIGIIMLAELAPATSRADRVTTIDDALGRLHHNLTVGRGSGPQAG